MPTCKPACAADAAANDHHEMTACETLSMNTLSCSNPKRKPLKRAGVRSGMAGVMVLAALGALAGLAGCGERAPKPPAATEAARAATAAPQKDPLVVTVPADMAQRFAVAEVQMRDISQVQEVAGRIEANEKRLTRIGAAVTGRVTEVQVDVGDRVARGQSLASVSSPELTQAQLAYLRAHATRELAERAEDRAQQLLKADVIGTAELQRRQSELAIASAELKATADQLLIMGIPAEAVGRLRQQGSLYPHAKVASPIAGTVIERKVSPGQVAQPGDPLFTVADLSNVWVVGALPEQTARQVAVGQKVEISVPALGERQWTGRIVYVGDTVSTDTRTLTVRTEVDNHDRQLKPQMLATLRLVGPSVQQPTVPAAAVVRENDRDHVYVRTAENTYRFTPVELGPATASGQRPLLKGPAVGTPVVVDGAFHLHNERKRAELQ
jgi:membrane fusion protein, heavy metal efflux system